jgi:hemolysin III
LEISEPAPSAPVEDLPFLKPRLRGVVHEVAFCSWLTVGVVLVVASPNPWARTAVAIYAVCMAFMLGASALLHRGNWSPRTEHLLGTLDHIGIFLAIAGTYTALAGIALAGTTRALVLTAVWVAALAGIVGAWLHLQPPRWLRAGLYVVMGWIAVVAFPALWRELGAVGFAGVLAGGLLYSLGAAVYVTRRPDPWPHVFGYHEVWHSFVVVAALLQLAVIAFVVIPAA